VGRDALNQLSYASITYPKNELEPATLPPVGRDALNQLSYASITDPKNLRHLTGRR